MADSPRLEELRRRVQADPASIAFAALAEEYRRAGKFREAVDASRAGLRYHPTYVSARVTLGRSLVELQEVEQAERELVFVLKSAPDNLAARRALGELCWQQLRFADALTHFRTAHTLAPADTELPGILQSLERELAADRNGANGKAEADAKPAAEAETAAPAAAAGPAATAPAAGTPVEMPAAAVPVAAKPSESDAKGAEAKVVEAKAVEGKAEEAAEAKSAELNAAEPKAAQPKAVEATPAVAGAVEATVAGASAVEATATEFNAAARAAEANAANEFKLAAEAAAAASVANAAEETAAPAVEVASVAERAAAASEAIVEVVADEPAKSEYGSGTLEIETFGASESGAVSVYAASPAPVETNADAAARGDAENLADADTVVMHVASFAPVAASAPASDADVLAHAETVAWQVAEFAPHAEVPADTIAADADVDVVANAESETLVWQATEFAPAEEVATTVDADAGATRSDAEVQAEIDARLEVTSPSHEAVADTHVADAGLADAGFDGRFGYSQITDARLADTRLGGMPEVEAGLADAGVAGAPAHPQEESAGAQRHDEQEESIFVAHGDEFVSHTEATEAAGTEAAAAEAESEFAEFEPIAFVEHEEPAPVAVQAAPVPPAVTLPRRENPALIRLERFHRAILVARARRRSQSHASDSVGQGY